MLKKVIVNHQADFETGYKNLNPAQREAVDRIEGPLVSVCGPGSGKTHVISFRIANLIRQGVAPDSILALTFTDSGATAMKERLWSLIGPDAAMVNVTTFHSWCCMVIAENPSVFNFGDLMPASDLEKAEVVQSVLDDLPMDNPLAKERGDLYSDTCALLGLYSTIKRESLDVETICAVTDEFIASLPDQPGFRYARKYNGFKAGDVKQHMVDAETKKYERFKAAARTFDDYQSALRARGLMDFEDMLLLTVNALRNQPDLLGRYQERYCSIMVDENQDSNSCQNIVLNLLLGSCGVSSVLQAGDTDQEIFAFQGASVAHTEAYISAYSPGIINLLDNYRSTQAILDAAYALISNNSPPMGIQRSGPMTAHKPDGPKPEVRLYDSTIEESIGIALELESLYQNGEDLSEVAVIFRNHSQAEDIVRYLTVAGVPYNTKRRENILETPIIRHVLHILNYISGESTAAHSQERLLFSILCHPAFGLTPLDVAGLYVQDDTSGGEHQNVRALLQQSPLFLPISCLIETAIADSLAYCPLSEYVHRVIQRFGILEYIGKASGDAVWDLTVINSFLNSVREVCLKNPETSLQRLVGMYSTMKVRGITLQAEHVISAKNGIHILSAHASKGLEFSKVYLVGLNESVWEGKKSRSPFAVPPLIKKAMTGQEADVAEARRLCYVAATRAKRDLVISYAAKSNNKVLAKSRFVTELEQSGTVDSYEYQLSAEDAERGLSILAREMPNDYGDLFTSELVTTLLTGYKLSVTHMSSYLKCPTKYFFTKLLGLETGNSSTVFGSAIHKAIEWAYRQMLQSPTREFPQVEAVLDVFTREMNRHRHAFTKTEFERRTNKGLQNLGRFYQNSLSWHKDVKVEQYYEAVLEGVPVHGKVDNLELLDLSECRYNDYKTGKYNKSKYQPPNPSKAQQALDDNKKPKHEDLFGGDAYRQAVFSKLLIELVDDCRVGEVQFCHVDPDPVTDEFVVHKVDIQQSDEDFVREQIAEVYGKILNREFDGPCQDDECEWCSGKLFPARTSSKPAPKVAAVSGMHVQQALAA